MESIIEPQRVDILTSQQARILEYPEDNIAKL